MEYSCEIIRDIFPIYLDETCSYASKQAIEEHLSTCPKCRGALMKLRDSNGMPEDTRRFIDLNSDTIRKSSLTASGLIAALLTVALVVCFVCNLVLDGDLDWFYIVLTALILFASVSIVPLSVPYGKKIFWAIICGSLSLLLMLFTISSLSGGNWFAVTTIALVFGLSVLFLPYLLSRLPLKGLVSRSKGLISMLVDSVLLYCLILVAQANGDLRSSLMITTVSAAFPWLIFLIIRYMRTSGFVKAGLCIALTGLFAATLNDVINLIEHGVFQFSLLNVNLFSWSSDTQINANSYFIIAVTGLFVGLVFICIGLARYKKTGEQIKG